MEKANEGIKNGLDTIIYSGRFRLEPCSDPWSTSFLLEALWECSWGPRDLCNGINYCCQPLDVVGFSEDWWRNSSLIEFYWHLLICGLGLHFLLMIQTTRKERRGGYELNFSNEMLWIGDGELYPGLNLWSVTPKCFPFWLLIYSYS